MTERPTPPGLSVIRLRGMFDAQMTNPDAQWCSRDEIAAILDEAAEYARQEQEQEQEPPR